MNKQRKRKSPSLWRPVLYGLFIGSLWALIEKIQRR